MKHTKYTHTCTPQQGTHSAVLFGVNDLDNVILANTKLCNGCKWLY